LQDIASHYANRALILRHNKSPFCNNPRPFLDALADDLLGTFELLDPQLAIMTTENKL
jgi:hypothetical protein